MKGLMLHCLVKRVCKRRFKAIDLRHRLYCWRLQRYGVSPITSCRRKSCFRSNEVAERPQIWTKMTV